ncbi:MAG TPA: hypothetical protein EYP42_04825 [Aquificales bacterium]|nr:hypothetical protein [Aquificales bacterium]
MEGKIAVKVPKLVRGNLWAWLNDSINVEVNGQTVIPQEVTIGDLVKMTEEDLKEVIEPIKSLSEIILLLNRDKVFTILKTLDKEIYVKISKRYESGLSGLDEKVKNLKKFVMNKKKQKEILLVQRGC